MIQRIQSLYLLLSAAAGITVGYFELWKAKLTRGTVISDEYFNASSSYLIFVVLMISILLSLVCIFLFKNRKLQFRLTVMNVLIAIGVMCLIYFKVQDKSQELMNSGATIVSQSFLLPAFLPVVMIVLLIMAARGIYKDERLIKSLDRLR